MQKDRIYYLYLQICCNSIYNMCSNFHEPRSWMEEIESRFLSNFKGFKGPSDLASHSNLDSESSCETNHLSGQTC
jgi:hypothetical protein